MTARDISTALSDLALELGRYIHRSSATARAIRRKYSDPTR